MFSWLLSCNPTRRRPPDLAIFPLGWPRDGGSRLSRVAHLDASLSWRCDPVRTDCSRRWSVREVGGCQAARPRVPRCHLMMLVATSWLRGTPCGEGAHGAIGGVRGGLGFRRLGAWSQPGFGVGGAGGAGRARVRVECRFLVRVLLVDGADGCVGSLMRSGCCEKVAADFGERGVRAMDGM